MAFLHVGYVARQCDWGRKMDAGIRSQMKRMAQKAKHRAYVASRTVRSQGEDAWNHIADRANPILAEAKPYRFDPSRYRRSFLTREPPREYSASVLPRRVFCCWTGENDLTPNRLRNLQLLKENIGVQLELVNPGNLMEWVVPDSPIHWAYPYLSLVHRSDYLRAYLLHHHGGGYVDIKQPMASWLPAFHGLERNEDKWILGYREVGVKGVVRAPGRLGRDLRRYYSHLIGCGAMIARSHTPLTAEWLREVNRRMDYYGPQLEEFPGGVRGAVVGYPISWTHLLGRIIHPLGLKYMDKLIIDDSVKLKFEDYK